MGSGSKVRDLGSTTKKGSSQYVLVVHPDGKTSNVLVPTRSLNDRIRDEQRRHRDRG